MCNVIWVAMVYKAFAEPFYNPEPVFSFAQQGDSAVGGDFVCVKLSDNFASSGAVFSGLKTFKLKFPLFFLAELHLTS